MYCFDTIFGQSSQIKNQPYMPRFISDSMILHLKFEIEWKSKSMISTAKTCCEEGKLNFSLFLVLFFCVFYTMSNL